MSTHTKHIGVVLMTYGSATEADGVASYFNHIHPGTVSTELIREFERRYRLIGHSPLIEITESQAELLGRELGESFIVRAGMRHSAPWIADAIAFCKKAGADTLLGIILSPQFSSFIMEGYTTTFSKAAQENGFEKGSVAVARPWPTEPHFIELLARRIRESLARLRREHGTEIPVVFTTHSLPQRIAERDPSYLHQLQATVDALRAQLSPTLVWYAGYQSAGHTPEAWLKPDLTDILMQVRKDGEPAVLIVPMQFLADHLEILYDLDIAAKNQCDEAGIDYHRIPLPNTDPLFIKALASVAYTTSATLS